MDNEELKAENARLKAEVERLKEQDRSQTESHRINTTMWKDEVASLKAEVERLTKAGAWQPMETAPFNRNIRIIVDRNDEGEVGIIWSSDVQHYSVEQYPDWWMPLPVAPAEEGNEQP